MSDSNGIMVKLYCAVITPNGPIQVPVALFYSKDNPFEVMFLASENTETGEAVQWRYARELLFDALNGAEETLFGEGDVQTFRENGYIYTILQQGDRGTVLAFQPEDIKVFLDITQQLVPVGQESVSDEDMDAGIAELLGSAEE